MNKNIIEGNWNQLKGNIKEQWGKFTDDDLLEVEGDRDQFVGKLQEKYGYTQEQAEAELRRFEDAA